MFPRPIEKASPPAKALYKIALPVALIIWLLPLLAVALTSLRSQADISKRQLLGLAYVF